MIKNTIHLLIIFLSIATIHCEAKKVLFIGNSYTSQCSRIITDLFKNESPDWKLTFHFKGGKDLAYHLADPTTKPMILSQKWDFVMLQEQSQKSGLGGKYSQGFQDAVSSFSKIIRKNGSTPCLYLTGEGKQEIKRIPKFIPTIKPCRRKYPPPISRRGRKTGHAFSRSVWLIQKLNRKTRHSLKASIKKTAAIPLKSEPMWFPLFSGLA